MGAVPAAHADQVFDSSSDGNPADQRSESAAGASVAVAGDLVEGATSADVDRKIGIETDGVTGTHIHRSTGGGGEGIPGILAEDAEESTGALGLADRVCPGGHRRVVDRIGPFNHGDGGTAFITGTCGKAGGAVDAVGVIAIDQSVAVIVDSVGTEFNVAASASRKCVDGQLTGAGGVEPGA